MKEVTNQEISLKLKRTHNYETNLGYIGLSPEAPPPVVGGPEDLGVGIVPQLDVPVRAPFSSQAHCGVTLVHHQPVDAVRFWAARVVHGGAALAPRHLRQRHLVDLHAAYGNVGLPMRKEILVTNLA